MKWTRLKHAASVSAGQSPPSSLVEPLTHTALPFLQGNAEFGRAHPEPTLQCISPSKVAKRGEILFSVRAPVGAINFADQDYGIGRGLCSIQPRQGTYERFLWYVLHSSVDLLRSIATGSTYQAISAEDLANLQIPDIDPDTQQRIADYLDVETARIDALIEKKERLATNLRQRKDSVLESRFEPLIRDSGCHRRLTYVVDQIDERNTNGVALPLLSVSIHHGVVPRETLGDSFSEANSYDSYKICAAGDVVLNRMRAFQGGLGVASEPGIVSPDYTVIRPKSGIDSRYLGLLFKSPWFVGQMTSRIRGIGSIDQGMVRTPRINFEDLAQISIPLPELSAQRQICDSITDNLNQTNQLTDKLTRQIELLKEHRQALITAAVTGEIEVPGVAA